MTAQQIRDTAELARLLVNDAELERLRGELSAILNHAAQLAEVDVTGVPPTTHPIELTCPLRADVVGQHDSLAETLGNAPASEGAFFVVPAVFAGTAAAPSSAWKSRRIASGKPRTSAEYSRRPRGSLVTSHWVPRASITP